MSWSPDLYIGELRPWPDSVHVVRGNTDETRRYMPERKDGQEVLERRIDELCAEVEYDRQTSRSRLERIDQLKAENVKLREYAARAWSLFVRHGAVHECDLIEVDAVRDGLRELGIEAG